MNTFQFLSHLRSLDVKLMRDGDQLQCDAPKGVLTPQIQAQIFEYKAEILTFLHQDTYFKIERIAPGTESIPLSFAQERLWFLNQLEGASATYNMPAALRLSGELNLESLDQALAEIVRRHESLRTSFTKVNGIPKQVIHPSASMTIETIDLQHLTDTEREVAIKQQIQQSALTPFDLEIAPLIRCSLIQLSETDYVFCINMHHIVSDGWSIGVLVQELSALYSAYCAGNLSPLPELEIQYADFALWQRQWLSGEVLEQQLEYWVAQLQGAPELLQLPTDRPRPSVQTYRGATHSFSLSVELTQQLQALSRQTGSTLFMTLMAAFATLLYRYSGESDVLIGSPIANRNRSEIEPLIGFFVNTLVLRTRLENNLSFEQLLKQVRENTLKDYEYQDVPFEQIVEALKPQRSTSHSPLFQVMFVLQNTPMGEIELPGVRLSELNASSTIAKFDLTLSISETPLGLDCEWEYNTDLFDQSTIERMASHFQTLLLAIVKNPHQTLSELPLLSEAERQQLLFDWNDTAREYPQDKCIHQLFEEQVAKTPDAIAVVFEQDELTYQQLNQRANQLAHHLQTLGVKPEVLVGICVERSLEMVVGLLGILKTGGAYVPLDPSYPMERLSYMVSDAGLEVLLTQNNLLSTLPSHSAQVVCLDTDGGVVESHSQDNLVTGVSADNLAYIIYTSGSTGQPKGVAIEHKNVMRLFTATQSWYQFNSNDVWTNFHSIAFDFSVWEIWGALSHGGRLVIVPYWISREPQAFYDLLYLERVTVLNQTPSAFSQLMGVEKFDATPKQLSLRLVIFGGEALELQSLKPWFECHGDCCPQLVNMYGITETTVHVTYRPLTINDLDKSGSIIGRPLPDLQMYILDDNLQPVPIGVKGQMYVGGDGLARGYLNRQQLSLERFIPHPFNERVEEQLYKTGDLARYLSDGNIEYLGRIDHQVKIRGFRIELGEIETALSSHPQIQQAVAIATADAAGNKRLVAYVVSENETLNTQQLREFLQQQLPAYMVPSAFVILDTLPLTPNGKVDRKTLPAPNGEIERTQEYVAPRTEIEQILANIWQELLLIEKVSIHDNFFELGGHSLLAVQLVAQIEKQFSLHLPLATLFQNSTIEQLAIFISVDPATGKLWSPLVPIQPKGSLPPFFCVAGAGGNVMYFHELAQYLGKDRPFYGLQAQGLDGETPPLESVEAIASQYIESIQAVQPVGPYFLGGHSFGGKVAFEMAQQLQRKGQAAYLTILDTTAPVSQLDYQDEHSNLDDAWWICEAASVIEELMGENLSISYEDIAALTPDEQVSYFKQQIEMVGFIPPQTDIKLVRGLLRVYRSQNQINYAPLNTSPLPITLFRAQDMDSPPEPLPDILQDPAWGWNQFSDREVEIYHVPGAHVSMMTKPNVEILAQHLQKSFDRAQTHSLETSNAETT
jgi:amino acid adenylation domain-containing protein